MVLGASQQSLNQTMFSQVVCGKSRILMCAQEAQLHKYIISLHKWLRASPQPLTDYCCGSSGFQPDNCGIPHGWNTTAGNDITTRNQQSYRRCINPTVQFLALKQDLNSRFGLET